MACYLIRHRLPGRDGRGMPNVDLYIASERPVRDSGGVSFTGVRVDYHCPAEHSAATALRPAESAARWRDLPSQAVSIERTALPLTGGLPDLLGDPGLQVVA